MLENIWELRQGDILLGTLTITDQDMFWSFCDFVPTAAFEKYRALFAEECNLIDTNQLAPADAVYDQISAFQLSLHSGDNFDPTNHILLHILNDEAWFRPLNGLWGGWVGGF